MTDKDFDLVVEKQRSDESDTDLVLEVIRRLVSRPDRVTSRFITEGNTKTLLITVSREDWKRVFSNQGRTARSLRTIVRAIAERSGHLFEFDLQPGEQE